MCNTGRVPSPASKVPTVVILFDAMATPPKVDVPDALTSVVVTEVASIIELLPNFTISEVIVVNIAHLK